MSQLAFDDDHAVANAGLALVGLLSEKLGLEELAEETISITPFPGRRVATLVHALVAGASCIDDADVLRSGATSTPTPPGPCSPPSPTTRCAGSDRSVSS